MPRRRSVSSAISTITGDLRALQQTLIWSQAANGWLAFLAALVTAYLTHRGDNRRGHREWSRLAGSRTRKDAPPPGRA